MEGYFRHGCLNGRRCSRLYFYGGSFAWVNLFIFLVRLSLYCMYHQVTVKKRHIVNQNKSKTQSHVVLTNNYIHVQVNSQSRINTAQPDFPWVQQDLLFLPNIFNIVNYLDSKLKQDNLKDKNSRATTTVETVIQYIHRIKTKTLSHCLKLS